MRSPLQIRGLAVVALIALVASGSACGPGDLDARIEYPGAVAVRKGDPVKLEGLPVGQIRDVELTRNGHLLVHIRIDGEYRDLVTHRTEFRVRRDHFLSSDAYLEIKARDGVPVEDGHTFEGTPEIQDRVWELAKKLGSKAREADLRKSLESLIESAQELREGSETMVREHLPEWERQAKELIEQAEETGESADSTVREAIKELRRQIDEPSGTR